jgi:hypothetical protein
MRPFELALLRSIDTLWYFSSFFTLSVQLIFAVLIQHHISGISRSSLYDLIWTVCCHRSSPMPADQRLSYPDVFSDLCSGGWRPVLRGRFPLTQSDLNRVSRPHSRRKCKEIWVRQVLLAFLRVT